MKIFEIYFGLKKQEPNHMAHTVSFDMWGYLAVMVVDRQNDGFLMRWNFNTVFDNSTNEPEFVKAKSLTEAFIAFIENKLYNKVLKLEFTEISLFPVKTSWQKEVRNEMLKCEMEDEKYENSDEKTES